MFVSQLSVYSSLIGRFIYLFIFYISAPLSGLVYVRVQWELVIMDVKISNCSKMVGKGGSHSALYIGILS